MSWNPNPPPPDPPEFDDSKPLYQNNGDFVSWGYKYIYYLGSQSFDSATTALNDIAAFTFPDPPAITFPDFPTFDATFTLPDDPTLPTLDTSLVSVPTAPTITTPSTSGLPTAPTFTTPDPTITLPDAPAAFTDAAPDAPSIDYDVALPSAPNITLPSAPTLTTQTLPTAPTISIPDFTGIPPVAPIDLDPISFSYIEDTYSRQIDVKSVVLDMLAGNTGLPPAVEQALFDRARAREDITAQAAIDGAFEDWSSRGFSLPGGEIAKRVEAVRQNNQNQANSLSRDILTKSWDIKVDALKFAVQQGIAYEAQLIDLFNQAGARKLQAAELTARIGLEYFNAQVALYNAQITGFNAQAELYRVQLQESAQKIEVYKGQLQAAQIIGELNVQQVQLYSELVKAQETNIEIYKAQIEGAKAEVSIKTAQVEQYKALVQGYSAKVDANKAQFEAYGEQVKAAGQEAQIYQSMVSAFAEKVRAYSTNVDANLGIIKTETDIQRLNIESYQASLSAVRDQIEAKSQQAQAVTSLFDAQARVYSSKVGAVAENTRSIIAGYSAQVASYQAQANISIENAKMVSENSGRNASLALEAQKGIAQVSSQIAAGALSAVNVHTGMSTSGSYSDSRSLGVSYSVDGGEGTPPVF